jgi:glycosyltransferase involved in cell wall biosynthesis
MRIAIATEHMNRMGGTETYLSDIIPSMVQSGHEISVFVAGSLGSSADNILSKAPGTNVFSVQEQGIEKSLSALRAWKPDLIYAHGMLDNNLETWTRQIAKTVFFVHVYHGMCVSGQKRFKYPIRRPCHRVFGAACLLHYHLRGCGGSSPVTMVRNYFYQKARLNNLQHFDAVVTHSFHMFEECVKHGVDPLRLHRFHYVAQHRDEDEFDALPAAERLSHFYRWMPAEPLKILFVARLDDDKGSAIIVDVMKRLMQITNRAIELTVAGDGPSRAKLERQSRPEMLGEYASRLKVTMLGWQPKSRINEEIRNTDLVVFASIWPEPFGLVGPESALFGKPVAAFDVGGVNSWLVDDVNGFLAPGEPPTIEGLAVALANCVRNERTYRRLSLGAIEMSDRFRRVAHLAELDRVFHSVVNA